LCHGGAGTKSGAQTSVGIGISFAQTRNGFIVVTGVHGTAAREEMFPSDVILSVNGTEVKDMHIDDVVTLIKGRPGTRVHLKVLSDLAPDAPHHSSPAGQSFFGRQPHHFMRSHSDISDDEDESGAAVPSFSALPPQSPAGAFQPLDLGKPQAQWARDKLEQVGLDSTPISRVQSCIISRTSSATEH
jgi:hypothetical protein